MINSHLIEKIKDENPLIHCLTNIVVANFQANGLLAIGASPIMASAYEETAEIAAITDCVTINVGTLHNQNVPAMIQAGQSANKNHIPVILDPVGVGATAWRKKMIKNMLEEVNFSVIRCNAGELAAIANIEWKAKGVDAGSGDADIAEVALRTARNFNCMIAVSGKEDIITDGRSLLKVRAGHPLMSKVTGTGCLLSSIIGAFLAVGKENPLEAVVTGMLYYSLAGEKAAKVAKGPGSFIVSFLDALYEIDDQDLQKNRVEKVR